MIFFTSVGGDPVAVGDRNPADPAVGALRLGVRQSNPVVICLVRHVCREERLSEPVTKHSGIVILIEIDNSTIPLLRGTQEN